MQAMQALNITIESISPITITNLSCCNSCVHHDGNIYYLIHDYKSTTSKFYIYNIRQNKFSDIDSVCDICDFFTWGSGDECFVYGKTNTSKSTHYPFCLMAFHFKHKTWRSVDFTGSIPNDVANYGICGTKDHLFVLGGFNNAENSWNTSLYDLDMTTMKWRSDPAPLAPRMGHTMTIHHDSMFVFGGAQSMFSSSPLKDLWRYDIPSKTWTQIETTFPIPDGLFGHECVSINKSLFIIGGSSSGFGSTSSRDIFEYDIVKQKWRVTGFQFPKLWWGNRNPISIGNCVYYGVCKATEILNQRKNELLRIEFVDLSVRNKMMTLIIQNDVWFHWSV